MSESLFGNSAEARIAAAHRARRSGFDCILGNPPWERVKLQEKEWFAERVPEIANAPNAAARGKMIKALATERPELHQRFLADVRAAEAASAFMRGSGRYPLCGRGDVNLYTVFAESMRDGVSEIGRVGCVVPSGIATDDTTKFFFQDLVDRASLVSLFDFENREGLFEAVDSRMKFACVTLRAPAADEKAAAKATPAEFVFFAHRVEDIIDENRRFTLTRDDIELVNPNTKTCPIFRTKVDAELTKHIYQRFPCFGHGDADYPNRWIASIPQGLYHQTNDAALLRDAKQIADEGFTAIGPGELARSGERVHVMYEGRMIHAYSHRAASVSISSENAFRSGVTVDVSEADLARPDFFATPRYWVPIDETERRLGSGYPHRWLVGFKDIGSVTNERTMLAALFPRTGVVYSIRVILFSAADALAAASLLTHLNGFAFDFVVRQKTSGNHITDYIVRQLPVIAPERLLAGLADVYAGVRTLAAARVLELSATADDMSPFSKDLWPEGDGAVFRYDPERRFEIRCELDAAFFYLYLGTPEEWSRTASPELLKALPTPRDAAAYIMETFPIVKRKDEEAHGSYRTKERILALYDELQRCLATGEPFKSTLNPPPGPPTNPDGTFARLPAWPKGAPMPANWPVHVHPPQSHRL